MKQGVTDSLYIVGGTGIIGLIGALDPSQWPAPLYALGVCVALGGAAALAIVSVGAIWEAVRHEDH